MMHLNRRTLLKNTGIALDGFSFLKIKKIPAMVKGMTLTITSIVSLLFFSSASLAQSKHNDKDHTHHEHEHVSMPSDQIAKQAKLITGQGAFVFS